MLRGHSLAVDSPDDGRSSYLHAIVCRRCVTKLRTDPRQVVHEHVPVGQEDGVSKNAFSHSALSKGLNIQSHIMSAIRRVQEERRKVMPEWDVVIT